MGSGLGSLPEAVDMAVKLVMVYPEFTPTEMIRCSRRMGYYYIALMGASNRQWQLTARCDFFLVCVNETPVSESSTIVRVTYDW